MSEVPDKHAVLFRAAGDIVTEGISRALLREDEKGAVLRCESVVTPQLEQQLFRLNIPHLSSFRCHSKTHKCNNMMLLKGP